MQIVQDSGGNVQEILLPNCNGSPAWQGSLVRAIQQASPLPAPPSESVFSHAILVDFVGFQYLTGAPDDEHDGVPAGTPQVATAFSRNSSESGPKIMSNESRTTRGDHSHD